MRDTPYVAHAAASGAAAAAMSPSTISCSSGTPVATVYCCTNSRASAVCEAAGAASLYGHALPPCNACNADMTLLPGPAPPSLPLLRRRALGCAPQSSPLPAAVTEGAHEVDAVGALKCGCGRGSNGRPSCRSKYTTHAKRPWSAPSAEARGRGDALSVTTASTSSPAQHKSAGAAGAGGAVAGEWAPGWGSRPPATRLHHTYAGSSPAQTDMVRGERVHAWVIYGVCDAGSRGVTRRRRARARSCLRCVRGKAGLGREQSGGTCKMWCGRGTATTTKLQINSPRHECTPRDTEPRCAQ
ncbi:MAG: hypothetical protein EOO41_01565 [Methanobacteriota archaeon]|nr:MAG: hypothetical protein EOO41_01565 [Euryarchaeota archaeon]